MWCFLVINLIFNVLFGVILFSSHVFPTQSLLIYALNRSLPPFHSQSHILVCLHALKAPPEVFARYSLAPHATETTHVRSLVGFHKSHLIGLQHDLISKLKMGSSSLHHHPEFEGRC